MFKKARKAVSLAITFCLMLSVLPAGMAFADGELKVSMTPQVLTEKGSVINIPINLTNVPTEGVSAGALVVNYDPAVLTYSKAGTKIGEIMNQNSPGDLSVDNAVSGQIILLYLDNENAGYGDTHILRNGVFTTLQFTAVADGKTDIQVAGKGPFYNGSGVALNSLYVGSEVFVGVTPTEVVKDTPTPEATATSTNTATPENTATPTSTSTPVPTSTNTPVPTGIPAVNVSVEANAALPEQDVTVDVNLSGVTDLGLATGELYVKYDKTKFDLKSVDKGEIVNSQDDLDFTTTSETYSEGAVLLYLDSQNAGFSNTHILSNGRFAQLTFTVKAGATAGVYPIEISGPAVAKGSSPFYAPGSVRVGANFTAGSIEVLDSSAQNIKPVIKLDRAKYISGDTVKVDMILEGVFPGDKTNSLELAFDYDGSVMELAKTTANDSIASSYIPYNLKYDIGTGNDKKLVSVYMDMKNNVDLKNGEVAFTAYFKIKDLTPTGSYKLTLNPVIMIDTTGRVYNVNNGAPVTTEIVVTGDAAIDGVLNIFLGRSSDDLGAISNIAIAALDQKQINDTYKNLKLTLKKNASDPGVVVNGEDVFVKNENGNYAELDPNDKKVKGTFRVYNSDTSISLITIDGVGYLKKDISVSITAGKVTVLSTSEAPIVVYPGDVGSISAARKLLSTPDGKINMADFSAWLLIHDEIYDQDSVSISNEDQLRCDFTKDNKIDTDDVTLFIQSFEIAGLGVK